MHHHSTGFEDHDHHHDHDEHSFGDSNGYESQPNFNGHDQFSIDDAIGGPPGNSPSASSHSADPSGTAAPAIEKSSPYRRVSIQKRQLHQDLLQRYVPTVLDYRKQKQLANPLFVA